MLTNETTSPDPIDLYVGQKVRQRRKALDQSQSTLAAHLGVSFQQVQKYERGANRISASMLAKIAQFQGCQPGDYFEGAAEFTRTEISDDAQEAMSWLKTAQAFDLGSHMSKMAPRFRASVLEIAKSLSEHTAQA